ncbi:MAG: flavodoxin family protein [Chloroflexota bacterium]
MAKRVLVLLGSPRKNGNSEILAKKVIKGVESAGAKVESFHLSEMAIAPCDACGACQKRAATGCVGKDDMQILYPKLRAADAIVIASPIYFFSVSAQTKLFLDRWYALQGRAGNPLAGKKIGILLTYGDADAIVSGAVNAINMFRDIFNYLHVEIVGIVHGSAWRAGEIKENPALLKEAYALGRKLGSEN